MKEYQAKEKLFLSTIMSGFADLKSNVLMAGVVKRTIRKQGGEKWQTASLERMYGWAKFLMNTVTPIYNQKCHYWSNPPLAWLDLAMQLATPYLLDARV